MEENILFSMRCRIAKMAVTWMEKNEVQQSPLNVVTALNAIGCLKMPGERIENMPQAIVIVDDSKGEKT